MEFLLKLSTSDFVAGAAAFIALCSFLAAVWQGWITRSHNKKTVRPMLTVLERKSYTDKTITLHYSIKNHGVGPAIVEEYEFKIKGVAIPRVSGGDYVKEVVKQAFEGKYPYVLRKHGLPGIGAAIPVGGDCILAEIEFNDMFDDVMGAILLSTDVNFSLRYKSLYDEHYLLIR